MRSTLIGQVGNNGLSVLICEELHCAAEDTTMPWEASMKGVRHSAVVQLIGHNMVAHTTTREPHPQKRTRLPAIGTSIFSFTIPHKKGARICLNQPQCNTQCSIVHERGRLEAVLGVLGEDRNCMRPGINCLATLGANVRQLNQQTKDLIGRTDQSDAACTPHLLN